MKYNKLSIASIVCTVLLLPLFISQILSIVNAPQLFSGRNPILGIAQYAGYLALIFSLISLSQIRRNNEKGKSLSLVSLVISVLWIGLVAFMLVGLFSSN